MRIKFQLFDGTIEEMPEGYFTEVVPFDGVYVSDQVKNPYCGLMHFESEVLPVKGPEPDEDKIEDVTTAAWLLINDEFAQIIQGLPELLEEETDSGVTTVAEIAS